MRAELARRLREAAKGLRKIAAQAKTGAVIDLDKLKRLLRNGKSR